MSTETRAQATGPPWQVRLTWEVIQGLPHPKYTYDWRWTESLAVDCAVSMKDGAAGDSHLRLLEAHVRGPGQENWRLVEDDSKPR